MEIIFGEERMPGEAVVAKMKEAAALCIRHEGFAADEEERTEISLSFVTPEDIRALNREYRGVDRVTDVLSFPQFEDFEDIPEDGVIALGDVVICTDQALLQADEYGHSPEREIVYLFVHSVLHLLGYDHMEESEKQEMRKREEEVMSLIGLERNQGRSV
ncbi:MAG: rRNA maturation RNase YbeY [Clostridia bacterium]|nr:rRNA maturation RNase YbeY [Clostridia bacterium]